MFEVILDDRAARAVLKGLPKQLDFAVRVAITRAARHGQEAAGNEIRRIFDRPTPYTQRSVAMLAATRTNVRARVFLREWASKGTPAADYLGPQITGGPRKDKRSERLLQRAGHLPGNRQFQPGRRARLDKHGNMNRGQLVKVLSHVRAMSDPQQNRGTGKGRGKLRNEEYFVAGAGRSRHLHPGIYQRKQTRLLPIMIFGAPARYTPRFDFTGIVTAAFHRHYQAEFDTAFRQAMETDRTVDPKYKEAPKWPAQPRGPGQGGFRGIQEQNFRGIQEQNFRGIEQRGSFPPHLANG